MSMMVSQVVSSLLTSLDLTLGHSALPAHCAALHCVHRRIHEGKLCADVPPAPGDHMRWRQQPWVPQVCGSGSARSAVVEQARRLLLLTS
jgi:hypothetical protein